jgi:hypothetical protein
MKEPWTFLDGIVIGIALGLCGAVALQLVARLLWATS